MEGKCWIDIDVIVWVGETDLQLDGTYYNWYGEVYSSDGKAGGFGVATCESDSKLSFTGTYNCGWPSGFCKYSLPSNRS